MKDEFTKDYIIALLWCAFLTLCAGRIACVGLIAAAISVYVWEKKS